MKQPKTITQDIVGKGDEAYEEFVTELEGQLSGFLESDEPAKEFARRLIGQFTTFVDAGIKRKKLRLG